MVSASTEQTIHEINKTTFRDELQWSALLSMNEQIEDQPESRTADGYKIHLELLRKRMIGQCLSELKKFIMETRNF